MSCGDHVGLGVGLMRTDVCCRLVEEGRFVKFAAIKHNDLCLKEKKGPFTRRK